MLRVVLDTNVLVSASIMQGTQSEILRLGKMGEIKVIVSPEILAEVEEVLNRTKFGFSKEQIKNSLEEIKSIADIIYPKQTLNLITADPEDNRILECAVEGKADYIISGDHHLLDLKRYETIIIVNAQGFLSTL